MIYSERESCSTRARPRTGGPQIAQPGLKNPMGTSPTTAGPALSGRRTAVRRPQTFTHMYQDHGCGPRGTRQRVYVDHAAGVVWAHLDDRKTPPKTEQQRALRVHAARARRLLVRVKCRLKSIKHTLRAPPGSGAPYSVCTTPIPSLPKPSQAFPGWLGKAWDAPSQKVGMTRPDPPGMGNHFLRTEKGRNSATDDPVVVRMPLLN